MLLKPLYTLEDFQRLTQDDLTKVIRELELEIPDRKDEYEYLFENINTLEGNVIAEKIVASKVLAGQVAVKWYKFRYDDEFSKEALKEKLISEDNGYGLFAGRSADIHEDIVSIYAEEDDVYTLKVCIPNGKRRVYDENGFGYKRVDTKKNIIVKIDINNLWLEIRSNYNKCDKVKRILQRKLGFNNIEEVSILERHNGDINCFKESLIKGFYINYKAIPNLETELTEEDCMTIAGIMDAVNLYLIDKDERLLVESLGRMNFDTEGLSIYSIFLAGIDHLGLQIKKNSENDLSKQSIYSIFKNYLIEDTGYISFSTEETGEEYTMQIGKKTNSIVFRSSVTENVISYIRNMIL